MHILNVIQGSSEWHAARAKHHTASEAPAMMGASKYQSRTDLLRAKATGLQPDIDPMTQSLFDRGHAAEESARAIVEELIGQDLYAATGVDDDGYLLASFDGITMDGDTGFEHKLWSEDLAAQVRACDLSPHYYWQLEQQILVGGLDKIIFVCSDGTRDKFVHMEYRAVPGRAEQLRAGWRQFDLDLAAYTPDPDRQPTAAGRAPETLPALRIEITGAVTASNLAEFKAIAMGAIHSVNRDLKTDQDFADAEKAVKWCSDVESRLAAAKDHALSQTASIDELFRTVDDISAEARRVRLDLEKLVKARKESIRADIVASGAASVREHCASINATLGEYALGVPASLTADLGAAIKGKKTLASIHSSVDAVVVQTKIAVSQRAESVRKNIAILAELSAGHESLFPDRVSICTAKTGDDLRNLISARIAEHTARESERAKELERKAEEDKSSAANQQQPTDPVQSPIQRVLHTIESDRAPKLRLGQINDRLAPIQLSADGLASLGFDPVATEKAAKLYSEEQFGWICSALINHITRAHNETTASAA